MADIFQPILSAPTNKAESFVQQGVVDSSTANAIESFGKLGTNLFKKSVLSDLEGTEDNKDFVDPSDEKFADLDSDAILKDLNLTNITAARKQGSLTGAGAAALVNSKAKQLITAHPYFADEVKGAVSKFFSGTGLTGNLFKDEGSLVDKAIEAGVKAGRVDPTASRSIQVRQVQAFSSLTITKNNLNLAKLETEVDEQTKTVAVTNLSKDWFNQRAIMASKELQDIVISMQDQPVDQQLIRLEQYRQDVDSEGRRDIDVARFGEDKYKSQFAALLSSQIDLEKQKLDGTISNSVYTTRLSNLQAQGELKIFSIPGVPETAAVFKMIRNLPVGLISGEAQVNVSSLMNEISTLIPDIKRSIDPSIAPDSPVQGSVPARTIEQGKILYKTLVDSLSDLDNGDVDDQAAITKELDVVLAGHADGIDRYADTLNVERWDQLTTFFADPRVAKFVKTNAQKFSPEARQGLDNALQFNYTRELLGAAQAQMRATIGSGVSGTSLGEGLGRATTEPVSAFVTLDIQDGEVQFVIDNESDFSRISDNGRMTLLKKVESLNKNYANRLNKAVKVSAHMKGTTKYGPVLKSLLEGTELIPKEAPAQP